ncbi:MAG: response regulator transcription factor [Deltaproteobacteria bacterium]|nr:response regulator transcription factor [Deltaproteobacteria bacterium]
MARILIVEDERALASALRRGLEDEGHVVDVAYDGADGLRAAGLEPHDVIVLDVMLPSLSGLELCRALRRDRATVPILMLTALDTTEDIVAGLDAGADDYLTKPFAFEVLLARIRSQLRRGVAGSPTTSAGPIEVDAASHRVRCDGVDVELTAKEFQLLEVLVRRKGTVHSKVQLVEAAWPRDASPESNSVEVHLASVRKKLGAAGALIHTVRGVGYVLRVDERAV